MVDAVKKNINPVLFTQTQCSVGYVKQTFSVILTYASITIQKVIHVFASYKLNQHQTICKKVTSQKFMNPF